MSAQKEIRKILDDDALPKNFRERMQYVAEYALVFDYSDLSDQIRRELRVLSSRTQWEFVRGEFSQSAPAILFFEQDSQATFAVAGTYSNGILDILAFTSTGRGVSPRQTAFTELMLRPKDSDIEMVYARAGSPHTAPTTEALEAFSQICINAYFSLYGLATSGLLRIRGELSFKEPPRGKTFDARKPPSPHIRREHYRSHPTAGTVKVREALVSSSNEWH